MRRYFEPLIQLRRTKGDAIKVMMISKENFADCFEKRKRRCNKCAKFKGAKTLLSQAQYIIVNIKWLFSFHNKNLVLLRQFKAVFFKYKNVQ